MTLPAQLAPDLTPLLDRLAAAVEDLLLTGLTTASETTRQTLAVAAQEASRRQLLRLASTLRIANEELGRFTRNEAGFSQKRLLFFLGRAWLLARGLSRGIQAGDGPACERLLRTARSAAVSRLEVVTLGVGKKIATGAFVAFEFRLRSVRPATFDGGEQPAGQPLVWSCIFPVKPGVDIPAEGFLHLPQKQKFNASVFLERRVLTIEGAGVTLDAGGPPRIALRDDSRVIAGDAWSDWSGWLDWDPQAALGAIARLEPTPFDLEVELQDEIVLRDWEVGESSLREETGQVVFPVTAHGAEFDAVVSPGAEGAALAEALVKWRSVKRRPPLYGLLHFELCRLILQPLSIMEKEGPKYLTISEKNIDRSQLLKALKF